MNSDKEHGAVSPDAGGEHAGFGVFWCGSFFPRSESHPKSEPIIADTRRRSILDDAKTPTSIPLCSHPTLPSVLITPFSPPSSFSCSHFAFQRRRREPTMSTEMKPFTSSLADPSSSNVTTGQHLSSASCAAFSHAANQKHFDKKENERHGAVNPNNDFRTADFKTADFKTFCGQWMML